MVRRTLKLPSKDNKLAFTITIALSIAFLLVVPVLGMTLIGFFADKFFHTSPVFVIMGIVIGFIGSMVNIYRLLTLIK